MVMVVEMEVGRAGALLDDGLETNMSAVPLTAAAISTSGRRFIPSRHYMYIPLRGRGALSAVLMVTTYSAL